MKTSKLTLALMLGTLAAGVIGFGVGQATRAENEKPNRFFEMRTYTTAEGKLDDLHARFRDHTNKLFTKQGMDLIGYWTPADGDKAENTLVYVLGYKDKAHRDKAWKAFLNDPDWKAAFKASRKNGPIVTKVESQFLEPTDYSPIK